ncbi:hypothetical protein [Dyadobacter crusticola]|uniref:hypothetical protein n=1 Tax=Dyadobacter crusticola TaxID=292407 RepID=UPI0004E1F4A8|nr:hypothetical protein [Dyadobacter crusticola]
MLTLLKKIIKMRTLFVLRKTSVNKSGLCPVNCRITIDGVKATEFAVRYTTAYPLIIFENKEQDHAFSGHFAAYRGFYDALMPRLRAEWEPKGIKPYVAHNYFTKVDGEGMTLTGGKENKDLFNKPISEWPKSDLMPGGTLSGTNLLCHAYYLSSADLTRDEPYSFMFSAKVANMLDKDLILYPQSTHEHHPNNFKAVYYPDGTFFKTTKQEYNPAEVITISFIAQTFGSGIVPFGAGPKTNEQFRFSRDWHYTSGNLWLKKAANDYSPIDQFHYWSEQEQFPGGVFEYCIAEGVRLYTQTFAKVIHGKPEYLDFRIDGKAISGR